MDLEKLVGIQHKVESLYAEKINEEDDNVDEEEAPSGKEQDSQFSDSYD